MIQEYFYEIIALIIILTALVIYFLIVRFKHEEEHNNFELPNRHSSYQTKKTDEPQEISYKLEIEKKTDEKNHESSFGPFILSGDEEGSFETHDDDEQDRESTAKNEKRHRIKGEVPPHGKISKDNFKEFAGVKLLIAEDNLINQKVINGLLSDSGIETTMADDGQIALDILEKNSDFDMILMDAHMPRVDGFEATRAIRANPDYEHIVVVALSGDTAADDVKKMMDSGMQEHLEKPLRMEALYDILYAYTKADTDSQSEYVEVVMTNELNGDKGLSVCGGDDNFYRDILKDFIHNYTDSSQQLYKLLQKGDVTNADALLLDLIGIAANIGADNIKEIAQELKEAIKDTQENSYVTLMDEYEKHLNALLKDIKEYL